MIIISYVHANNVKMCANGTRSFLLKKGMPKEMVRMFFRSGIDLEDFKKYCGSDAMAQQVIDEALKHGW